MYSETTRKMLLVHLRFLMVDFFLGFLVGEIEKEFETRSRK